MMRTVIYINMRVFRGFLCINYASFSLSHAEKLIFLMLLIMVEFHPIVKSR